MIFIYDGSYEGLLSCIFVSFKERIAPVGINAEENYQFALLDTARRIDTNESWAARVLKGIDGRTNASASALINKIFLSELPLSEMLIYQVVQAIIQHGDETILENFANPCILKAAQIEKMIGREVHRMHAFVRFQENPGGLFCAAIEPDFNILPLIGDHFERRYADQAWVIFDVSRNYGLYYDQLNMSYVRADDQIIAQNYNMFEVSAAQDIGEKEYQSLWESYFHAVNINERNNPKLHLRHVPRRYWKYLTEKKPKPKK
ncbi:MAG TPA: hypothetical protein DIW64_18675 [Cellvibrio sp.]|nr:hypothetical protein [Cellvibrio sp.]